MGGSFGIALINTYIAHRAAYNRTALVSHITATNYSTQQRIQSFTQYFMAKGAGYYDATKQALGALEATVVRQTYLLSYMDAFLLIGIMNACCIPLVIVTIKRRKKAIQNKNVVVSDH